MTTQFAKDPSLTCQSLNLGHLPDGHNFYTQINNQQHHQNCHENWGCLKTTCKSKEEATRQWAPSTGQCLIQWRSDKTTTHQSSSDEECVQQPFFILIDQIHLKRSMERDREREMGTLELNMLIEKGRETKGDLDIRHRPQGTAFIIFHVNFNKDYENKLIIKSYHDATSYVIMKTT